MKPTATIKVQKNELQSALTKTSKTRLAPAKCSDWGLSAVFSSAVFVPTQSSLWKVVTTDTKMLTEVALQTNETEGTENAFALPVEELLYMLRRLDEQELLIELYEYQAVFHHSFGKFTLPLVKDGIKDFLQKRKEAQGARNIFSLELENPFFLSVLSRLNKLIACDMYRPVLETLCIRRGGGKIDFVASNGTRLVRITKDDESCMQPATVLIPAKAITILRNILQRTGFLTLEYSINPKDSDETPVFILKSEGLMFYFSPIEGRYPDYTKVIPVCSPHTCIIERSMLSKALDRIGYLASNRGNICAKVDKGHIALYGKDKDFATEAAEKLECEHSSEPFQFGMNTENVRAVLNMLRCKKITLSAGNRNRAIVVLPDKQPEGEQITAIFMPCYFEDEDFEELCKENP